MQCPICEVATKLRYKGHPGYSEPQKYDIYNCPNCKVAFADPLKTSSEVYNLIYKNRTNIIGYKRYEKFAEEIVSAKEPLQYLSDQEDTYWGIQRFLTEKNISRDANILEIGCGLGYLTYSILKKGFKITGIDISKIAVENARKKFGDHYICHDVMEYSKENKNKYDVIIMTEVIEHVEYPVKLIKALNEMVVPGGYIVVTTPNKSFELPNTLWFTEAPPIHLYWFSERTMKIIAKHIGLDVDFVNYCDFNKNNIILPNRSSWFKTPVISSTFDSEGNLLQTDSIISKLKPGLIMKIIHALNYRYRLLFPSKRRGTMCVVFQKNIKKQ